MKKNEVDTARALRIMDEILNLKIGDIVQHDFREDYDRETYKAAVVGFESADGDGLNMSFVKIAAIDINNSDQHWFFNGMTEVKPISRFKEIFGTIADYNLRIA